MKDPIQILQDILDTIPIQHDMGVPMTVRYILINAMYHIVNSKLNTHNTEKSFNSVMVLGHILGWE